MKLAGDPGVKRHQSQHAREQLRGDRRGVLDRFRPVRRGDDRVIKNVRRGC